MPKTWDVALQLVQIFLAATVALGYFVVAGAVVPRLQLDERNPRFARAVRAGAFIFFVGCGLTHTHILIHAIENTAGSVEVHEVLFHAAQVGGVWVFALAALRVLDVKIERRKSPDELLQERVAELSRENADLEAFAHAVSHDLQEPLATIRGFADLLARQHADELGRDGTAKVEHIRSSTDRMQAMLVGVLAYSKAAGEGMQRHPVALDDLVDRTARELGERLGAAGARVETGELPMVFGDELQLGRVLQNLMVNAVKFRRPDRQPVIRVSARELEDGSVRVDVADNGVGIPETQRDHVFGMFARASAADATDGTGIGLAVCQKVVARHGGRIWVEGNADGGSTFSFTLPQRPAADRELVPA